MDEPLRSNHIWYNYTIVHYKESIESDYIESDSFESPTSSTGDSLEVEEGNRAKEIRQSLKVPRQSE
jgi:hypothetical protein